MRVYQKFTRVKYRADFLFFFSPNEYSKQFSLGKNRAERQIKFQARFLSVAKFYYWYVLIFCGNMVIRMAARSVTLTSTESIQLYYAINSIKIVGSILFFLAFQGTTLGVLISTYEAIASCKFLSNCLDDLSEQVFALFSGKNRKKLAKNDKYLTKRITSISKCYAKLLTRQYQLDRHFDQSLHFMTATLLFSLVYPAALIFDSNMVMRKAIVYSFNYFSLNLYFFTIVIFNSKFLNSKLVFSFAIQQATH